MTVFGVLLIAIAVLLLIAAVAGGSNDPATLDMGLFDVSTSTMGVFLIGAATVLIFVSGLELVRSGLRRTIARRRELKKARSLLSEHEQREQRHEGQGDTAGASSTGPVTQSRTTSPTGTSENTTTAAPETPPDTDAHGTTR